LLLAAGEYLLVTLELLADEKQRRQLILCFEFLRP
jgi:hypothetical protein